MTQIEFQDIFMKQMKACEDTLQKKKKEYAGNGTDRLGAFKTAASLQKCSAKEALAGMFAKHVVSIYEMCGTKGAPFPVPVWEEKITDSINYLILLRALVEEEK
ncbi:MAG: hypothetical protein IKC46_04175 [Lachnospiraceae bacterium]|nr:hypothetical protein [Lachnospiraceae bacterium]